MNKIYKQIKPSDVYYSIVDEELTAPEEWRGLVFNDFGNYPTQNNFIDLFAGLVRKYGHRPVMFYANKMGIDTRYFSGAIIAMTGMEPREWIHEYLNLAVCEMIVRTKWPLKKIAQRFNFSQASFSRFFRLMNKCQPYEWLTLNRYGQKYTYHY